MMKRMMTTTITTTAVRRRFIQRRLNIFCCIDNKHDSSRNSNFMSNFGPNMIANEPFPTSYIRSYSTNNGHSSMMNIHHLNNNSSTCLNPSHQRHSSEQDNRNLISNCMMENSIHYPHTSKSFYLSTLTSMILIDDR